MLILFQGDSITDAGRNKDVQNGISMGEGYPDLINGRLSVDEPGKVSFLNYGISGNRVVDLYARIKRDGWNQQPDVISILIGVNDVWHEFSFGDPNGVDAERFQRVYEMLIEDTKKVLPNVKILILEPFTLKGTGNEAYWEVFDKEVRLRAAAAKAVAEKYDLIFVPLQERLDKACELCPADYWLADGVHPTPAGHQLIADAWIQAFRAHVTPKENET